MNKKQKEDFPYLPIGLLQRYEFPTYKSLEKTKCPVVIFHGDADKKIPVAQSYELKKTLKPTDKLIILKGQGHNRFVENATYIKNLQQLLK